MGLNAGDHCVHLSCLGSLGRAHTYVCPGKLRSKISMQVCGKRKSCLLVIKLTESKPRAASRHHEILWKNPENEANPEESKAKKSAVPCNIVGSLHMMQSTAVRNCRVPDSFSIRETRLCPSLSFLLTHSLQEYCKATT